MDRDGFRPRHTAADHGCLAVVDVPLRDCRVAALVNAYANDSRTPLPLVAQAEFVQPGPGCPEPDYRGALDRLVRAGADVRGQGTNGATRLHRTAGKGPRDLAVALLTHGASIHVRDGARWVPLHWAASRDQRTVASLLVARRADVSATTDRGETVLGRARARGHQDIVLLLVASPRGVSASALPS